METTIPFSGFYNSIHDQNLEFTLEQMFSDDIGDAYPSIFEKVFNKVEWGYVHREYAKHYTEQFAKNFKFETLKFKELVSPKYYNFETDRIFCKIDLKEVVRIFNAVDKDVLQAKIKDTFTSYDGFISHYSNKLEQWPKDLEEWDHNQIGTLIAAYVEQESSNFGGYEELDLVENSNGDITRILDSNIEEVDRFYKIVDYLRARKDRK